MKIEDHRKSATFGDIEVGGCFEYEGDVWMKVKGHRFDDVSNAVDILCGALMTIEDDEKVWRVDAKAVIERESHRKE